MTYRNRKLLNLAHSMPCMASFPHQCTQHQGCEPAHANGLIWGKGVGFKAPDHYFASMCHNAHDAIDNKLNKTLSADERPQEWLRAYISTQDWLWENGKLNVK